MDTEIVEELTNDLMNVSQMLVVIDSGGAVSEMHTNNMRPIEFKDGWAVIESDDWHVHLNVSTVYGVHIVEAEDSFHDFPKLYYVRYSDADENTLIRFYFPNPWLDENEKLTEFQPDKLRLFEEFRDRYVGTGGIVFVERQGQRAG